MTQEIAEYKSKSIRRPKYETVFWVVFLLTTTVFTVDRFTTNVWPRQSFGNINGIGNDKTELKDGGFGVKLYDILARVSGRVVICTMNALFITMMHTTFNYLSELKNVPVDFNGWQEANQRIHVAMGWLTGVMIVPHVWSPFFPAMFDGWTEIIWAWPSNTTFQFPISEWKPGCPDLNTKTETICFNIDNLGRLIGMTVMFCFLFPLSRWSKFTTWNWMAAKWLHVILAALYAIDNIRRRSHPHSWVLNFPVCVLYVIDRIVGWYYYRVDIVPVLARLHLGDNYCVLYWRMAEVSECKIADVYWLKAEGSGGVVERLHPFTCSTNHLQSKIPRQETVLPDWEGHAFITAAAAFGDSGSFASNSSARDPFSNGAADSGWGVSAIVKVYPKKRGGCCGMTQTPLLGDDNVYNLNVMGPYRSVYSQLSVYDDLPEHVTLIASGSGASVLLDFVSLIGLWERQMQEPFSEFEDVEDGMRNSSFTGSSGTGYPSKRKAVSIVYTTRSMGLFQYVTDRLVSSSILDLQYTIALTAKDAKLVNDPSGLDPDTMDLSNCLIRSPYLRAKINTTTSRINFHELLSHGIPSHSSVYFCGSPQIYDIVTRVGEKVNLKVHDCHAFDG